jgi:hypothetical protein
MSKGKSPIPVLERYHNRIVSLNLKDRTADGVKEVAKCVQYCNWALAFGARRERSADTPDEDRHLALLPMRQLVRRLFDVPSRIEELHNAPLSPRSRCIKTAVGGRNLRLPWFALGLSRALIKNRSRR